MAPSRRPTSTQALRGSSSAGSHATRLSPIACAGLPGLGTATPVDRPISAPVLSGLTVQPVRKSCAYCVVYIYGGRLATPRLARLHPPRVQISALFGLGQM